MKIEITSITARNGGAEIALTVRISQDANFETRNVVLLARHFTNLSVQKGEISEEKFGELSFAGEVCSAVKRGMYILGYGASSKKNMAIKLVSKGFSKYSAKEAADFLEELGYINECSDAEREAEKCVAKMWGKRRIVSHLFEKEYCDKAVKNAANSLENTDFYEICKDFCKKKYRTPPENPAQMKKIYSALARNGFSSSEIKYAIECLGKDR